MNELHPKSTHHRTMSRFSSSKGHDPDDELCALVSPPKDIFNPRLSILFDECKLDWTGLRCEVV
jgi:hypothetical protein